MPKQWDQFCLQSLLSEWRSELARQPLSLSESEACEVLRLTPNADGTVGEEELRRAYRWDQARRKEICFHAA